MVRSVEEIVARYIHDRPSANDEMGYFASQPSLRRAIQLAALSITEEGLRHPHQRRIPRAVLEEAKDVLNTLPLRKSQSFHELHTCIAETLGLIRGIGELTIYDIATRIGAFLGLEPEKVYLHAGTRAGAHALGLKDAPFLERSELPGAFAPLKMREVEDCLCIYKSSFRRDGA